MKKWISRMAALLLVLALAVPVLGAEAQLNYVTDAAGLLTTEQREDLEKTAASISWEYECGVYIITLEDFRSYSRETDIYDAAVGLYQQYDLGYGPEKSGELLVLSMAERDYALIACGYGNTAFTDYGKDRLSEAFLDDFGDDDWYGGFADYLSKSERMLASARAGSPLDVGGDPKAASAGVVISIALGCLISLAVCFGLRSTMNTAREKTEADAYIRGGAVRFTTRMDQFTHRTQTRVKIEKPSSSGGGTTVGGGGFSGKSGKF